MTLATGQRREEMAQMRWADIDEDERTWILSSEMTKAGRAHVVPPSPLALEILGETKEMARLLGGEPKNGKPANLRLHARGDRPISGYSKAKARLDKAVAAARQTEDGLPALHPGRSTICGAQSAPVSKLGISRFIIARVLNHADRSVTGIYDRHEYLKRSGTR